MSVGWKGCCENPKHAWVTPSWGWGGKGAARTLGMCGLHHHEGLSGKGAVRTLGMYGLHHHEGLSGKGAVRTLGIYGSHHHEGLSGKGAVRTLGMYGSHHHEGGVERVLVRYLSLSGKCHNWFIGVTSDSVKVNTLFPRSLSFCQSFLYYCSAGLWCFRCGCHGNRSIFSPESILCAEPCPVDGERLGIFMFRSMLGNDEQLPSVINCLLKISRAL